MPKASAANPWVGAPPVSEGGFAFANGDFFAEASGQNRHRRATLQELKTHFASGSDKDHPAHWFEAQLIHYGLQPSKTKSVARMRLFDAVNAGKLKVPADMTKLEGKLKKEWTKKDREAKKASTSTEAKKPVASGGKRKAEGDAGPSTAKKPKAAPKAKAATKAVSTTKVTTTTKTITTTKTTKTTKAASTPKATSTKIDSSRAARRGGASAAGPSRSVATAEASTAGPKQTARARRGGISQGPSRAVRNPSPEPAPRTKQTARRSNPFFAHGRIPAPPGVAAGYDLDMDDAPPPYSEYPEDGYRSDGYSSSGRSSSNGRYHSDSDDHGGEVTLAPLGLLNGAYRIDCPDVAEGWSHYDPEGFDLVLTLAGSSLWGKFDLGVYEGVLYFEERPWDSSYDRLWFKWRGREDQGPIIYGNNNEGWIKFLGDGRIEGWLDHQSISFSGRRIDGQGTRPVVDARRMQSEWDGYSEDEYDRENRARWH